MKGMYMIPTRLTPLWHAMHDLIRPEDRLTIFGSIIHPKPGVDPMDVDCCLDVRHLPDWRCHPTVDGLRLLAQRFYGYLDPFFEAPTGLYVRSADAATIVPAQSVRGMRAHIRQGVDWHTLHHPHP